MKVLIIRMWADELDINNYNCQEIGLAKALIKQGNKCDLVLYTKKEPREEFYYVGDNKKIRIYYMNAKNILKNCFYDKKIYDIIKEYDVVQSTEYDQIANLKLYKVLKDKLVIYHGPYNSKYTKRYRVKCLISDLFFAFNQNYKKVKIIAKSNLAKDFLISKGFKNIWTIGVGLDTERFSNIEKNADVENLKLNKLNEKYILYVGKIEDRRNILFLLEVFGKLYINNKNLKLILVGKGQKDYLKLCKNYIDTHNLQNGIIYFGSLSQKELPELYNCSDVFVLTTKYEIFGMVLLEALYFNLPIITTMNGGSSTLINEKNGIICNNWDVEEWTEAIKKALNMNLKKVEKKNITWDEISPQFLKIYQLKKEEKSNV